MSSPIQTFSIPLIPHSQRIYVSQISLFNTNWCINLIIEVKWWKKSNCACKRKNCGLQIEKNGDYDNDSRNRNTGSEVNSTEVRWNTCDEEYSEGNHSHVPEVK